jgi:hypothetical protein
MHKQANFARECFVEHTRIGDFHALDLPLKILKSHCKPLK